jgi:RNA polymerase sigma factor (sigma-70 family)
MIGGIPSTACAMQTARTIIDPRRRGLMDHCDELHTRFRRPLQRFFATYRLNADDVDDFTQEVFLRLIGVERLQELRTPDAFVFTLARNLLRDRARRLYTRAAASSVRFEDADLPCGRPTPDEVLESQERLDRVVRRLEELKPATREAFYLNRLYGNSYAETAVAMGVSVSMVEKHIMLATAFLQKYRD